MPPKKKKSTLPKGLLVLAVGHDFYIIYLFVILQLGECAPCCLSYYFLSLFIFSSKSWLFLVSLQPLFPGESGVDQLVEIIKVW